MRFAAASSASNYIAAGRNAASASASIQSTARAYAPNYGDLAAEGLKQDALNFQQEIENKKNMTITGINIDAKMKLAEIDVENAKARADAKSGLRKAGAIAAAGKFAADGLRKPIERAEFDDGGIREHITGKMTEGKKALEDLKNSPLEVFKPSSTSTDTSSTVDSPAPRTSSKLEGVDVSDVVANLTPGEMKDLAYVVSAEAERGTDDEYAVAASVINRKLSGDFPNTISDVIYQPKQYEAITKGLAKYDDALAAHLGSEEGRRKITNAMNILEGRTDFKGQTQLKNRVAEEDPMFHDKGNFFHYSYQ